MTESMTFTSGKLLVAIDVAKRSHDALVRWPDGKNRSIKVQSSREGFDKLVMQKSEAIRQNSGHKANSPLYFQHLNAAFEFKQSALRVALLVKFRGVP